MTNKNFIKKNYNHKKLWQGYLGQQQQQHCLSQPQEYTPYPGEKKVEIS